MGQPDRQRHEARRLAGGEAEHDALVAGALTVELVDARALTGLEGVVDALGDVGRLRADRDRDAARAAVEPDVRGVVADLGDPLAHDGRDLDVALGRDLARDVHEPRGDERLDGDPGLRIDSQQRVEDRVADLVAHLVGVTFGHRFGREKTEGVRHRDLSFGSAPADLQRARSRIRSATDALLPLASATISPVLSSTMTSLPSVAKPSFQPTRLTTR